MALSRHREGVSEGSNNKSFLSGREQRHNIRKNGTTMATKTTTNTDMVKRNQETLFNKVELPYLVPVEYLERMHPYIKILFCARKIPYVRLAGRLNNFIEISDKWHRNSVVNGGLCNTILWNSSTEKYPKLP